MKRNRFICLLLIYAVWTNFFTLTVAAQNSTQTEKKGLQFRLREGAGKLATNENSPNSSAVKLSEADANAIFRRLPPIDVQETDAKEFAVRPNSLPPPKTGKTIPIKFPSESQENAPNVENPTNLEVVRFAPSGTSVFTPDLSVTFSQPMIAVSSQTEASQTVPVQLTPEVKGKWRWLGTKTLIFDADKRFPMATRFTAKIPAGTKSANGATLQTEVSWEFSTPAPKVESFTTSDAKNSYQTTPQVTRHDTILLAKFNQDINAETVLPKIKAIANGQNIALRLAMESEIKQSERLSEEIKKLLPNRWIAFRAAELFPLDSTVNVTFEAGIPSAEGNLTSASSQDFSFKTYGSLKFKDSNCDYSHVRRECKAYEDWNIEFNNSIDAQSFDKSLVKIEPNIEDAKISIYDNEISIDGAKEPRKTYKVTISKDLKDIYGQTLGNDLSVEFKVGASDASLFYENNNSEIITLDPFGKAIFSVYSVNYPSLKVKIYAVTPEDYEAYYRYNQSESKDLPTIGKLVYDKNVKIKSKTDISAETKIDLAPAMPNGLGHAILIVEPPVITKENESERIIKWIQKTNIGIDAFSDYESLNVYASDLKSGKPLVSIGLKLSNGEVGVTNENGLGTLQLPRNYEERGDWLIAQNGADTAILLENNYYNSDKNWSYKRQFESLRWFVFDDRKMYRPGETVSVKGYIRKMTAGKLVDVEALGDAASGLNYVLRDSLGNEVLRGNTNLNTFGAFDFQLKLPENINLGYQRLELETKSELQNKSFSHSFQVQEFRRPEFEVSAQSESRAPFYVGDSATVSVEAKYYSGGGLGNAETNWTVKSTPTSYTPPNRDDFTFGKFIPWWRSYYSSDDGETTTQTFAGKTDANGKHYLAMDFEKANPARPFSINAEARVQDVNRQTFAGSTTLLVHPSELYVGLRTEKTFVGKNETFRVETITTDVDGKAVADAPVSVVAELKDWEQIKGEWQEITVDTQNCQIKSANGVSACDFTAKRGGKFKITATVLDKKEQRNESELDMWVAGGKTEPSRNVEQETIELIPDKKEYQPNETAEILVNAPFFPAEGVLTLRRNGVVKTERFTMNESSTVLKIPIEDRFVPNLHIQVDLFGATKRIVFENETDDKLPKRPTYASGELNLDISTDSRKLKVAAEPIEKTLEPGGETSINVAVTDNNGKPAANTEVAVIAVDESVLALTNYTIQNPLDNFYQQIESGVENYYSRGNILLANPEDLGVKLGKGRGFGVGDGFGNGSGGGGGGGSSDDFERAYVRGRNIKQVYQNWTKKDVAYITTEKEKDQIRLRQNFDALAIFSPSVRTDASGKATVKINLPDNLTRYRITAVAVNDSKKFGKTESAITARQKLSVRPSAPRFMNFGDKAELPVVLQNQTNEPLTIDVAVRGTNANLTDGNGRRITIAANDRAEIRFPLASAKVGIARFQIGAVSGNLADAAEFAFPVYTPATSEAFATYGTTDENGAILQKITAPENVFPQFGGLEITTSSTQLQELTDAFIYLQSYPYECSEQVSSRILSVAALRDVLQAFDAKDMPSREEIEAKMTSDIEHLRKLQHRDGGFSFWKSDDESLPYLTVHVAHALSRAKQKGYQVSPQTIQNLLKYLRNIENNYPPYYNWDARYAVSAYALYVRDLLGDTDAAKARKLLNDAKLENLSVESLGWILSVLTNDAESSEQVNLIKRNLLNRATETANAAHFTTEYKDGEYVLLSSDRRADGVVLEALLNAERGMRNAEFEDLIPKIVRGLLANKTKGRWKNTQENAFVLLALDKYFQTFEKVTPNFVAKVWLGQNYAGEQKFVGRSVNSNAVNIPMQFLQEQKDAQNLILDKQGDGRLYYRIGLKYAPKSLNLDAADYGFTVTRSYEAIDKTDDVRKNADGSWTFKSGARIRVRLQMVAPVRRYHVALVDNLPAGLEIVNANLAVSETLPEDNLKNRWQWFDHENLRDERAEVFKALLSAGVWNYSYVARATTPGNFTAPPAKAEEMYSPETFGRSATDFVKVE